jgi:cytoskeletal protein RodZ
MEETLDHASVAKAASAPTISSSVPSLGRYLRRERELRQLSLEELAQTTRIPVKSLQRLEMDLFEELPGDVFTRGFVRSYARCLGISADEALKRYEALRKAAEQARQDEISPAPPITAITPPEKGRRFGIAVAVVILLILFTLALSIVLRPRHRDEPVELSNATPAIDVSIADA